jgi:sensor histidine kinase regulating citrate/malate metabolism
MTLRRRITLLSVGMTALVILAFAIPLAVLAQQVIENDALAKARTTAVNVADYCTSVDSSPSALREYLNRVNARSEAKTEVTGARRLGGRQSHPGTVWRHPWPGQ